MMVDNRRVESFLVIMFSMILLSSFTNRDKIQCESSIDLSYKLSMKGYVEDVGFNDMFFDREILLIKNRRDSLRLVLERSDYQGIFLKKSVLISGDSLFQFYNKDDKIPLCVELKSFNMIQLKVDLDTIKSEEIFLCGIPGTY